MSRSYLGCCVTCFITIHIKVNQKMLLLFLHFSMAAKINVGGSCRIFADFAESTMDSVLMDFFFWILLATSSAASESTLLLWQFPSFFCLYDECKLILVGYVTCGNTKIRSNDAAAWMQCLWLEWFFEMRTNRKYSRS